MKPLKKQTSLTRKIWGWVYPMAFGVGIALAMKHWVVSAAVVPSGSMEPTIPAPSYIVVNKLSTEFSSLHRGEVVLFHWPDDPSQIFVKRIIGLPGDTVTVTDHAVYVNGSLFQEPYIHLPNDVGLGTYHVPDGHYFMMGDNRPISKDSRLWTHKFVPESAIVGEAVCVIFPFGDIRSIPQ